MESLRENIKVSLDESLKKRDNIATSTMRLLSLLLSKTVILNLEQKKKKK